MAKKTLSKTPRKPVAPKKPAYVFREGERVLVKPLASTPGVITRLDGNNACVTMESGPLTQVRAKTADLEPVTPELAADIANMQQLKAAAQSRLDAVRSAKTQHDHPETPRHVPAQIDLHAFTYERAYERTQSYIDEALAAGLESVRIIHGHGTGQVKRAVEQVLRTHPRVVAHHPVPGVAAITVNLR